MGKRLRDRGIPLRGTFGSYRGWPFIDGKPLRVRDRMFPPRMTRLRGPDNIRLCEGNRQLRSFENRSDSDKIDIQEKLSSDIVTTAKPQSPSRLASQGGSDQSQTTRESEFDIQEKLSSDIVTTAKPHLPSRLSISKKKKKLALKNKKKKLVFKRKASENKKKKLATM